MKNKIQDGKVLTLTAPYQRNAGEAALVGKIFGVAVNTVASGVEGEFETEGVFDLTKLTTDDVAQGVDLYWDNTNKRLTVTATGNTLVAKAVKAAGTSATTVLAKLNA